MTPTHIAAQRHNITTKIIVKSCRQFNRQDISSFQSGPSSDGLQAKQVEMEVAICKLFWRSCYSIRRAIQAGHLLADILLCPFIFLTGSCHGTQIDNLTQIDKN